MSTPRHRYVAARPTPGSTLRRMGPRRLAYHKPTQRGGIFSNFLKRLLFVILVVGFTGLVGMFVYKLWIDTQAAGLIYEPNSPKLPSRHVALVFGAGLNAAGEPSAVLYDRVATAVDLYNNNKVDKLVMTGDNSTVTHNEVEAMRKTAVELGVEDEDIILDYAGFNTWDSCYRAREIFSLKDAILVTQRFHLPRALHTCNYLGVNSVGVAADRQPYSTLNNELREYFALMGTAWRIVTNDQPKFLGDKVDVDQPQER